MNFLSIDCSTEIGSLFAKFENKTYSKVLQSDKYINDLLAKHILDFIDENHLKLEDLEQIFVKFIDKISFSKFNNSVNVFFFIIKC